MSAENIIKTCFEIGGAIAQQIFSAIKRGDSKTIRRLADVFPEPLKSRIVLLEAEAEARRRVEGDG
jgi:hypothetical protein